MFSHILMKVMCTQLLPCSVHALAQARPTLVSCILPVICYKICFAQITHNMHVVCSSFHSHTRIYKHTHKNGVTS